MNDNWFVRTEAEDAADLESYYSHCEEDLCVGTSLPATAADLFPKADTPLWFYKKFRTDLMPDPDHGIYLSFDQAVCLCEAWVNGIRVGKHVHSEEKFSFDVTRALKPGENLIACRVYGPVHGKIGPEGISMKTAPNFGQVYNYYTVISKTGINGRVRLIKKPLCAIEDLFVLPDPENKSVKVALTLKNRGESAQNAGIDFRVLERGTEIVSKSASARVGAGESEVVEAEIQFDSIRLWSPDDPNLYTLSARVKTAGEERAETRFGFKSMRVENGFFILNGKRIWLSSAHIHSDREALLHAKAMGFKAIRFLTQMPPEELLDFCDEIGLMVYEECAVAWGMSDYPEMHRHMAAYLDNMIKRDRNHVSVCIWGIFNEQAGPCDKMRSSKLSKTSDVFDFAVGHLPQMRRLDPSRLILLSSGRWDAKRSVGSFSNPGSEKWEFGWGEEAPDAPDSTLIDESDLNPYIIGLGDVHVYPTVPISNRFRDFIRTIGRGTKPVFL
ncbi:MAG: hypothetical protein IJV00_09795, partial [Clostridia bacterium]|nr:hypothetical protein [Clostridia bacterium]